MDYLYAFLGISMDIILLAVMAQVLVPKRKWQQVFAAYFVYGLAVLLMNIAGISVIFKMAFCTLMIYLILTLVYERAGRAVKFGIAVLYIIILCIPEVLIMTLVMLLGMGLTSVEDLNGKPVMWFVCMAAAKAFTYFIVVLVLKIYRGRGKARRKFAGVLQYGPLVITLILLALMAFMLIHLDTIDRMDIIFILCLTAVAVFSYTLAHNIFIQMYFELREKDYENKALRDKNQLQYKYYSSRMCLETEMQKIYHDLKNYSLMLNRRNIDTTDLSEKLIRLTEHYKGYMDTGNEMLNIILSEKTALAGQYQIKLTSIIALPGWYHLSDMETCTVFGNLLDNAIEAAAQIEQTEKRKIIMKGYQTGDNALAVKISNPYGQPVRKNKYKILSSKSGGGHGIGLDNVMDTITKRGGHMSINISEDIFQVSILFYKDDTK